MPRAKKPVKTLTVEEAWGMNGLMAMAAFRYCCGRMTYIVGVCVDWLIANWDQLPDNAKQVIQRDLEDYFKRDDEERANPDSDWKPLGHDCDREQWQRVRRLYK